jgi:hypothetical protein
MADCARRRVTQIALMCTVARSTPQRKLFRLRSAGVPPALYSPRSLRGAERIIAPCLCASVANGIPHQRSDTMSASKKTIGYAVQLAGIGAFAVGAILSLHHAAIAAAFAGGAAAFYVGEKIRTMA